tara:strand:+ start:11993 stop:12799 length:807 start_codon:yes stop_codon:yes gene_type:complete
MSSVKRSFDVSKGVMLASVYDVKNDPTGMLVSEKYDGIRAIWTGSKLKTRQNKDIHAPKWFIDKLPSGFPLDGELFSGRSGFEATSSFVRKLIPVDVEWQKIIYMVFDAPVSGIFTERYNIMKSQIPKTSFIKIAPQTKIISKAHFNMFFKEIVSNKGEGVMLRFPSSGYEQKRSKLLLKHKPVHDAEAKIIGVQEGTGKYEGMMGALKVENLKTKAQFKIGTGFTNQMREEFYDNSIIGKIVTYKFRDITKYGIPKFVSFFRFRNDK